jgi:hypothetical protein
MADPLFRLLATPAALSAAPDGWAAPLLGEADLALLADGGGLDAITAVSRALGLLSVPLLRTEADAAEQERTAMAWAGSMPLVWVAPAFGDEARRWARDRGPMTLLVEADGLAGPGDRQRVERFVAILGRQAE